MIVDLRKSKPKTVFFLGEEVEVVEDYRYLGDYLDSRLNWKHKTKAFYKKGQHRL